MTITGFWGLKAQPGLRYSMTVEVSFQITMVSLDAVVLDSERCSVWISIEGMSFVLANLIPGKVESNVVSTTVSAGELVDIWVTGNNTIHLTGNYLATSADPRLARSMTKTVETSDKPNRSSATRFATHATATVATTRDNAARPPAPRLHSAVAAGNARMTENVPIRTTRALKITNDTRRKSTTPSLQGPSSPLSPSVSSARRDSTPDMLMGRHPPAGNTRSRGSAREIDEIASMAVENTSPNPDHGPRKQQRTAARKTMASDASRSRPAYARRTNPEKAGTKRKSAKQSSDGEDDDEPELTRVKTELMEDDLLIPLRFSRSDASKSPTPEAPVRQRPISSAISAASMSTSPRATKEPKESAMATREESKSTKSDNLASSSESNPTKPRPHPEAKVLPNGLTIHDRTRGTGLAAKNGDKVSIHYTMSLTNGQELDNRLYTPMKFTVGNGQRIRGLEMGVIGMKPNGTREIIIPPALAYGDRTLPDIPANSHLTYLVTLVKVERKT